MYYGGQKELVFRHLYDDKWAAFLDPNYSWELKKIVFPEGFQPETGNKYTCSISETATGIFVYNDEQYRVCRATLVEAGDIIDVIDYKYDKPDRNPLKNSLADKPKLINRESLPESCEIVILKVVPDRKKGGFMFDPQYRDNDPLAGGKPSMRFYESTKKVAVRPGELFKVRVKNFQRTPLVNKKGAAIVKVQIDILEKV